MIVKSLTTVSDCFINIYIYMYKNIYVLEMAGRAGKQDLIERFVCWLVA